MKAKTRIFGEIDIEEDKIIILEKGMVGFPDYKKYTLIFDTSSDDQSNIIWFQSLDDEEVAFPVIDPLVVKPDYNPVVEDAQIKDLGEFNEDNMLVLVTVTAPSDIKKLSVNLRAPIIINTTTLKASQVILEDTSFPIKYNIYEIMKPDKKEGD